MPKAITEFQDNFKIRRRLSKVLYVRTAFTMTVIVWNLLQKLKHAMNRRDENISPAGFIELGEAIICPLAWKEDRPSRSKKSKSLLN